MDETYIGGKEKSKHRKNKKRLGRGGVGKQIVLGFRELHSGRVHALLIDNTDKETLHSNVRKFVRKGATVFSDELSSYMGLEGYFHEWVSHGSGEYVNGDCTTNGIESFWNVLKRGYYGAQHWWSKKHMIRYVREFCYRQNHRDLRGEDVIGHIIESFAGKRQSYAALIA